MQSQDHLTQDYIDPLGHRPRHFVEPSSGGRFNALRLKFWQELDAQIAKFFD